jgi:signal transduction histidine kinase
MRLRSHLALLVLLSVAPLSLFAGYLVWQDLESEDDVRRTGTRDTVRALSLAIDRELRASFSVLETMAASPALAQEDLKKFHQLCAGAVLGRKGVWIILFDATGQQILNSSRPFGSPLPNPLRDAKPPGTDPRYQALGVGGQELIRKVLSTGKAVVSDLFVALDSGEPKIGVAIPILRNGAVVYVLEMSVEPDTLLQIFRDQEVPSTWTASILDQKGLVIARSINPQARLGRPIAAELAAQIAEAPEGEGTGHTLEGVRVYHAFARCRVAPWTVSVGVSMEGSDARRRRTLVLVGGGALFALGAGLMVAWLMGRRISASISTLAGAADAMATGEGARPEVPAVKEVQELRGALIAAGARKRAQDEIARANVDLDRRVRERTAELEAFTYTVAHDLRAPLRAMQGFSDLVLEDAGGRLEPVEREYLKRISQAAERMDALVRDLLAYSRLGSVEVKPESVDLGALVRDVLRGMEEDLHAVNAEVEVQEGIPRALAQRPILFQVVANLISNAAKFVAPGVSPRIRISAQGRDGWVRLLVEDNGIGVDPQYREKLFGVFERLHARDAYPGTGIGLAIVKRAVERMGGRVGVEPHHPCGSVFWFELPQVPESPGVRNKDDAGRPFAATDRG